MMERKVPSAFGYVKILLFKPGIELKTQKPNADYTELFNLSSFLAYFDAIKNFIAFR